MSLTPMMQQYLELKEKYKDCILFFRLGDFYEMFFEDAKTASKELEITLTGRDCGLDERAPMCGVPFHSADNYIARLISKGFKVAICEQIEDPSQAVGIVKRDVVRVVTPGTLTEASMLDEKRNNYLMSIYKIGLCFGLAVVDISTGEFFTSQILWGNSENKLIDETAKYSPVEIIANEEFFKNKTIYNSFSEKFGSYISNPGEEYFDFESTKLKIIQNIKNLEIIDSLDNNKLSIIASGALLKYLETTQKMHPGNINSIIIYNINEYMTLDVSTRRNLELTETMREKKKKGSLLWVIDRTVTAMGGRTIRKWIEQPLLKIDDIKLRLDAVEELKEKFIVRMELIELLRNIYDIERLISRNVMGNINCRDLIALKTSLYQLPYIKDLIINSSSELIRNLHERIDTLKDVAELIEVSIINDPPMTVKEGGIIKKGYSKDVDSLRNASSQGKQWIAKFEESEKGKTGIKNLKTGYNKVFGYYIEITKSYYSMIPENYIRKQTLANCERFITQELKEMENNILGADEKIVKLEYEIFTDIRNKVSQQVERIKDTSSVIAVLDSIAALAETAERENYVKPFVNENYLINIKNGRHPVVEKMIKSESFVPNDTLLDTNENRLIIITGPNMAGKSTYMRQTALIVLLAQAGSFVPADYAEIGIADRIFTRVGASDDLASGRSTFMVEMSEVAVILENATSGSLLVLDEIGRGTSTYDGLSIAWSVVEHIVNKKIIGARTLFATHYHELTELEGMLEGIKNYCILVERKGEEIIFLRKIIRGGADDSFGIEVAKLAGIPDAVTKRAREILKELEDADISRNRLKRQKIKPPSEGQISLFSYNNNIDKYKDIINGIKNTDITNLTPVQALNRLYEIQKIIKEKGV